MASACSTRSARDHPGLPVVMLTAVHDIHVATNAFRRGAVDYLLKPFERSQLLESRRSRASNTAACASRTPAYRQNLEEIVSARTSRLRATMHDLERSYDITLEAMGDALDLRDAGDRRPLPPRHRLHHRPRPRDRPRRRAARIIARGAFLHDIGKIATPDRILLKPGKLNPEEMDIMRQHCARGYEMVRKIPFLREASEIVYAHQETFDGTGYPRGLAASTSPSARASSPSPTPSTP